MGEQYITMAELEAKYPGHWVLLDRPTKNDAEEVNGGHLVFSHTDVGEFDRRLPSFRLSRAAVLHVYDPFADPIEIPSVWIEDDSMDDEDSSSSPPSSTDRTVPST